MNLSMKFMVFCILNCENSDAILSNCLNGIVAKLAKTDFIYTINIGYFLEKPAVRLNLSDPKITWHKNEPGDLFIIRFEKNALFEGLSTLPIFNPRGTFLLVADSLQRSVFSEAATLYINQLLVLDASTLRIFSYKPFQKGNANTPITKHFLVGSCNNLTSPKFAQLPKKWPQTRITALNNIVPPYSICPKCATNRGIEIEIFEIISQFLGFGVSYTRDEFDYWGHKEKGSYTHILGELQERKGEVAIGVFHSKFDEHLDFDMSYSYMEDSTRWLVPKAKILPYWKRLGLIFAKEVYLSLIFSIIFMVTICAFLYQISYSSSWIMLYQILLEISLKELPFTFRFVLMLWICSCLILSTMFKSKLIDIMSKNSYEPQISNLKDIIDSKLEILIDHDIALFYRNYTNSEEKYIRENYNYCMNPRFCINRTAYSQDCVTVDFQRSNDFFLSQFVDSEGDLLTYLFKTPIFLVHIHLFFVKGYPLFPQIDKMLLRLRSNGVVQHLYDNASHNAKLAISKKTIFKVEVLGLEQLQVAFFIWGSGVVFAVVVFVGECLIEKGLKEKRKMGLIKM